MTLAYALDPEQSQLTVQAFASGLLSFLGHSPTFLVRDFRGGMRFPPETPGEATLEITVQAESLQLLDPVSPKDREEIEGRMRSEVLETPAYPTIAFAGTAASGGKLAENQYRALVEGRLTLHGVTNPLRAQGQLTLLDDRARLAGSFPLRMSDYRIRPVIALGGAIKLKDAVLVTFDLAGPIQASQSGVGPESSRRAEQS
jgi:polyisoprenoid-binding protein YceI